MGVVVTSKKKKGGGGKQGLPLVWVLVLMVVVGGGVWYATSLRMGVESGVLGVEMGAAKAVAGDADQDASSPNGASRCRTSHGRDGARPSTAQDASSFKVRQDAAPPMATGDSRVPVVGEDVKPEAPKSKLLVVKPQVPPKVFDNEVEDWLEAISKEGFSSIQTPRVNMSDEEVMEILKQDIVIYDDDSEEVVAAKERTAQIKQEAIKYIEDGGTFNQFLRAYADTVREEQETVNDVREEMKRILFSEGEEAAQTYLDGANPKLAELGLKPVTIGRGLLFMLERKRQKELEESQNQ